VHLEEEMQEGLEAGLARIEADLHRLGVAFMVRVGGVGHLSAGVAHLRGDHPGLRPDEFLHAPETAPGQGGQFDLLGRRLRRAGMPKADTGHHQEHGSPDQGVEDLHGYLHSYP